MSSALSIAVNGLNASVAKATQAASNIVNASSTGGNVDGSLIALKSASTGFKADAAVIKTVDKMNKALLDITV
jgi:flagellar hook protein FlgE